MKRKTKKKPDDAPLGATYTDARGMTYRRILWRGKPAWFLTSHMLPPRQFIIKGFRCE